MGCKRVTERVSRGVLSRPFDSRYPAAASYNRQYLADESATGSYAEVEVTNVANKTAGYQSDSIYAGQVRGRYGP